MLSAHVFKAYEHITGVICIIDIICIICVIYYSHITFTSENVLLMYVITFSVAGNFVTSQLETATPQLETFNFPTRD